MDIRCCAAFILLLGNLSLIGIGGFILAVGVHLRDPAFAAVWMLQHLGDIVPDESKAYEVWLEVMTHALQDPVAVVSIVGVTVGVLLLVMALAGVVFSSTGTRRALVVYALLELALALACLTACILLVTGRRQMKTWLSHSLIRAVVLDYHLPVTRPLMQPPRGVAVGDYLQQKAMCCGISGSKDYTVTVGFGKQMTRVPWSCCRRLAESDCLSYPTQANSYVDTPCIDVIWAYLVATLNVMAAFGGALALFLVGLAVIAFVEASSQELFY